MFIYMLLFGGLSFFAILEMLTSISRVYIRFVFSLFVLLFFSLSFLRWQNGTDWYAYYNLFVYGMFSEHYEFGYLLFIRLVHFFTDDYTAFLFIQGFIFYALFLVFAKKINDLYFFNEERSCYFITLLYLYGFDFAGLFFVRSTIAYMLCLVALIDIVKNKKNTFIAKVLIATTFHYTSIFFLLAYPLFRLGKIDRNTLLGWFGLGGLFVFISQYIDIPSLIGSFKYSLYLSSKAGNTLGIGFLRWLFLCVCACIFFPYIKQKYTIESYKIYEGIANIYFFGFFLYCIANQRYPVLLRSAGLFMSSITLSFPFIVKTLSPFKQIIFTLSLIAFCFVSLYGNLVGVYSHLYIPFHFFWDFH